MALGAVAGSRAYPMTREALEAVTGRGGRDGPCITESF